MVAKKKVSPSSPVAENEGRAGVDSETFSIGDTVRFVGPRSPGERGSLLEDYGQYIVSDGRLDRDWAPPRRWAVALDSGRLAFADDAELEPISDNKTTDLDRVREPAGERSRQIPTAEPHDRSPDPK